MYTQGKKKRTTYFFKVFARILWNQMYVFESHICPWHFSPVIWDSRLARSRTCTIFTMPVLFPLKKWKFYVVRFFFPWVYTHSVHVLCHTHTVHVHVHILYMYTYCTCTHVCKHLNRRNSYMYSSLGSRLYVFDIRSIATHRRRALPKMWAMRAYQLTQGGGGCVW